MTMLRMFPVPLAPLMSKEILIQLELQLEALDRGKNLLSLVCDQSAAQHKNILKAAFSGQLCRRSGR